MTAGLQLHTHPAFGVRLRIMSASGPWQVIWVGRSRRW